MTTTSRIRRLSFRARRIFGELEYAQRRMLSLRTGVEPTADSRPLDTK